MTTLYTSSFMQPQNINGIPLVGAKLFFYQSATSTPVTVYQDFALTTPHANPVIADSSGIFAPIFLGEIDYKVVLKTSADITIQTVDPVQSISKLIRDFTILYSGTVSIDNYGAIGNDATLDTAALTAALATGRFAIVPGNKSYIFTPNTAQAATILSKFDNIVAEELITVTLPSGVMTFTGTGDIMPIGINSSNVRLIGATPVTLTMTSVSSVTGSTGNWTVVYNVVISTGVNVGDILKNFEVGPIPLLNGDNVASYVLRNRPLANELMTPVTNIGTMTFAAGGGSASFSGGIDTTANCLAVNDLLTCMGQTRVISSVGAGTCNITGAWAEIGASQAITYFVTKPNAGTITIVGTAVTGVGTAFLTQANVGDMLLVDGAMLEITAVASDVAMTLQIAKTLGAATSYSIITGGVLHDGAYVVTSVGSGTVTVTNRNRLKPPINAVTGGSFRVIKTVLKHTGTGDGFKFQQNASLGYLDAIAVQGPRTGSAIGLAMGGRVPAMPLAIDGTTSFGSFTQNGYSSNCITGPDLCFLDWAYNVFLGHGCHLNARMIASGSATVINVWQMEGSYANLRRATISGSSSLGHAMNAGSGALITECHHVGNASDGLRLQAGATIYGEAPAAWGNGVMNYRLNATDDMDISQGINVMAGASAFYMDRSGGQISNFLIAANRSAGIDGQNARQTDLSRPWITGNGANGINAVNSKINVVTGAVTSNANIGIYANLGADVRSPSAFFISNFAGANIRADNGGVIVANLSRIPDLTVTGINSFIDITGAVGAAPAISGVTRLNEFTKEGVIVRDGASTSGLGVAGLRPNGGSNLSFFKGASSVQDCGSIAANGQLALPADVTVTGATATGMTAEVNSNYVNASVIFYAQIVAADTVRVYAVNSSGAAIDPGNATYTIIVKGYTA